MDNNLNNSNKDLLNQLVQHFEQFEKQQKEIDALNEKLFDSEKMKSNFLSNIKNEINNPISAILGLSYDILKNKSIESIHENAELIFEETSILNFQLKNIFCAAEIESGFAQPEYSNVNITSIIQSIIHEFSFISTKKNIKIQFYSIENEHFVTDAQKLSLIISNLVSNALKFSDENSEIELKFNKNSNNQIQISVTDNGIGINDNDQYIIFDRFKQIDYGMRKQFSGHGLGLSIVNALVDTLNGKIELNSTLNKGTTVTVYIPQGKDISSDISESDNSFLFIDENSFEQTL